MPLLNQVKRRGSLRSDYQKHFVLSHSHLSLVPFIVQNSGKSKGRVSFSLCLAEISVGNESGVAKRKYPA